MLITSPSGRLLKTPTGVLLTTDTDTPPPEPVYDGPFDPAVYDPAVFDA